MELWQQVKVNKWRRLDNPDIMGWQTAAEAGALADFFESLNFYHYDRYGTEKFDSYVEGQIRGYQFTEQAYEDMIISTTHDLHSVQCSSFGLHDFDCYMSKRWESRFDYARENGI